MGLVVLTGSINQWAVELRVLIGWPKWCTDVLKTEARSARVASCRGLNLGLFQRGIVMFIAAFVLSCSNIFACLKISCQSFQVKAVNHAYADLSLSILFSCQ